ncbi:helix-turn-helix domain-containing protein [Aquimarina litoralis]|uniref:helix-turn-helix domain-containing protein n=1 Tax=Aquimarina litoralis TaxID=584605 RepID=UPI001C573EC6|nr:AraC family transcriptional regulator [Aquimarina litoralis]
MAFRVGKSVMLNFGDNLEPVFIFIGLAFLLLIGPLLRWYVLGMTIPNFKLDTYDFLELLPFCFVFGASFFVSREWYENSNLAIVVFGSGLIFIYLHLIFYIVISFRLVRRLKKSQYRFQTKSQKAILHWLYYLIIGSFIIWITYVLNILDGAVPYIVGPIVYSIVIYFLSYKAYQLQVAEIDGKVFSEDDSLSLFNKISQLMVDQKLYLDQDISLLKLSQMIEKTKQQTSTIINQYAKRNFNDYINYYRIQEAKRLFSDSMNNKFTISSIAFDAGFNSLSSFNQAFKKFEGITPSKYRESIGKK